tara:strand:- start:6213 stop:6359 length:147 start_codon:yes stop_codon:yes gene_type:complete
MASPIHRVAGQTSVRLAPKVCGAEVAQAYVPVVSRLASYELIVTHQAS